MAQAAGDELLREAPVLDIDPYSVPVLTEPYEFQEMLREAGPVAMIRPHGVYAVGRYEECATVLNDYQRFTAKGGIGIQDIRKPGEFRVPNRMLENDPPGHTEIRAVMTRYLSPIVIRRWREHFEKEAAPMAEAILERGTVEGVEEIAEAFVLKVFPEAVGIDLPRREILAIGEMRFNQSGPQNELYRRAMERAQPYLEWFENSVRREAVKPGSIADSLFGAEDRGEFPEPGLASNMVRSLIGGGSDSTIAGIGHTLHKLAENPDQFAILKADPNKARLAFEEAIRLEPSFHVTYRTTTGPVELSGVRLDPDTKVGVYMGAANRDPRKFENPDRFLIDRNSAGIHVGFGSGAHGCIGQMIARIEAEAILKALVKITDKLELAGTPRYRAINQMRMLEHLPLKFTRT